MKTRSWYEILCEPKSLAIIGASNDANAPGGRMLRHLREYGYPGQVYLVNAHRASVQGESSYPSIEAVEGTVELAVIMVPAAHCVDVLHSCGERGVRVAIVGSSGFAEVGENGKVRQRHMLDVAKRSGIRLIGPNCNGVTSLRGGLVGSTIALDEQGLAMSDDGVAVVTQSGAIGGLIFAAAQRSGLGVGLTVAIGNAVDVTLAEVLTEFSGDPHVRHVFAYTEGLSDGPAFVNAVRKIHHSGKSLAILKAGKSEAGSRATLSHTGTMAGEAPVFADVISGLGVAQAKSLSHLVDVGMILKGCSREIGTRVSIVSMGGGTAVLATDLLEDHDLTLATWSPEDAKKFGALLPRVAKDNPFDTGDLVTDAERLLELLALADEHGGTDVTVLICAFLLRQEVEIAEALVAGHAAHRWHKPVIIVWLGGRGYAADRLNTSGVPCFPNPERAIAALAAVALASRNQFTAHRPHETNSERVAPEKDRVRPTSSPVGHDARTILRSYGLATVPTEYANSVEGASAAAAWLGYPVVMKLESPILVHKTDAGAVQSNIQSDRDVRGSASRLLNLATNLNLGDARLCIQTQLFPTLELLLAMTHDVSFGPVLSLGVGGTTTELIRDVTFFLPDFESADIPRIVSRLRHRELFRGYRGQPAVDLNVLTETLAGFTAMVNDLHEHFSDIELNPLLVCDDGHSLVVVDSLMIPSTPSATTSRDDRAQFE